MDHGLRIIESAWAPPGTIYIIDPSAFEVGPAHWTPTPVAVTDASSFRIGMQVSFSGLGKDPERDPMEWPRPRTFRALWRQMCAIVGYEFRKASGRLRRYPRRTHAVITGITD